MGLFSKKDDAKSDVEWTIGGVLASIPITGRDAVAQPENVITLPPSAKKYDQLKVLVRQAEGNCLTIYRQDESARAAHAADIDARRQEIINLEHQFAEESAARRRAYAEAVDTLKRLQEESARMVRSDLSVQVIVPEQRELPK